VNTLVTGLIVFKILKVSLEVKATSTTSVERTLGKTSTGTKFRHVVFIIIESGMALLVVQLARLTFYGLEFKNYDAAYDGYNILLGISEMFNVISILFRVVLLLLFLLIKIYYLARASHQQ
jgi:uncharacterized membrane protein